MIVELALYVDGHDVYTILLLIKNHLTVHTLIVIEDK